MESLSAPGRKGLIYLGRDAAPITLGTVITDGPTASVHCNTSGTAILTFASGRRATIAMAEGARYDYAILKAETAGGTDPELVALF